MQVREKVHGTLQALVGAATGAELRLEFEDAPAAEFDAITRHLMSEFTIAAGRYIAGRRIARYRYRDATGPILAGSLDMPATMRLHAAGRLGQFAYREGTLVRDEPLDRLVLAGLDELDRAADALDLDASTLYDARWLATALDEVRDEQFLATSRDDYIEIGDMIARASDVLPPDLDLARLASVALLHRGFELEGVAEADVPRALFIDLETLFEQAVRVALNDLLNEDDVDRGGGYERRLFSGGTDSGRANPDLVVHRTGQVRAVGDVKYKLLDTGFGEVSGAEEPDIERRKKESRADVYQLLVHARSLGAEHSFLVYAGEDRYACRYLGLSKTGANVWTVQVRPPHVREDLQRFLVDSELAAA